MDAENAEVSVTRARSIGRPDAISERDWLIIEAAADGKTAMMISRECGLRKYQVEEILRVPEAAAMLLELRQMRTGAFRERLASLTEDALDYAAEVLRDPLRHDTIRVHVMDSILDRAGFARQTKVETNVPPQMVIPGIERLSIEQLTALATGVTAGLRPQPAVIDVTEDETP